MTESKRTAHPYDMYESILAQPGLIGAVLRDSQTEIARAADAAAAKKRLIFAGIGTSGHAAHLGAYFLRMLASGRFTALVEESFELVNYPLALGPDDALVVISHRGWKNYSVEAVRRAKAAGALSVAITGRDGGDGIKAADFVLTTCEQEVSYAHTKSCTTALAILAALAIRVAEKRNLIADAFAARKALNGMAQKVRAALACEPQARAAAAGVSQRQRLIFVGAGPNWITAREAALKVKETSYVAAEGFETEEFLHGPISEMDSRAALVAHLTGGPGDARTRQILAAVGEVGVLRIAVSAAQLPAATTEHTIEVPAMDEWLSPFVHVVAAQLLSYFLALQRGTSIDLGRDDSPDHARARKHYQL